MSEVFRVIYTGKLEPSANQAHLVAIFSEKFKLGQDKAQKLISSGRSVTLKKDLDRDKALKYREALEKLGMVIEIDPDPDPPPEEPSYPSELTLESFGGGDDESTEVLDQSEIHRERCPKCGSGNMQLGICQSCGIVAAKYIAAQVQDGNAEIDAPESSGDERDDPYSPPEADLEEATDDEMVGPRSVSMGRAFAWVIGGWRLFSEAPWSWMIALVVFGLLSIVISLVPFLGPILISLLGPVLVAGFMIGCNEQDEGGKFSVSYLFAGFSQNAGQNILVGLLYLLSMLAIGAVMGLIMVDSLQDLMAMSAGVDEAAANLFTTPILVGFGLFFIAFLFVLMAYIFAPALVALDDLSALQAMKLSFVGCLKNILPLFLYLILSVLLFMLNGAFSYLSAIFPIFSMILFAIGFLVLFPIQIGAIYTAYRDIFYD
ncbi:MAG: BPSS1780 family membrane protein [Candidatus Thiodiazotropha sp. L084R]